MQNIPIRTPEIAALRKAFMLQNPMPNLDLSKIEKRVMAQRGFPKETARALCRRIRGVILKPYDNLCLDPYEWGLWGVTDSDNYITPVYGS